MYHLDKLMGPQSDDVTALRRANLVVKHDDTSRDVGMLAPRHGMFRVGTTEYFAHYKGAEIQVSPADVEAMKAHGFKDAPGQPPGYGKRSTDDLRRLAEIASYAKRGPHDVHASGSYHPRTEFGHVPVDIAESDGFPHRQSVMVAIDTGTDTLDVHGAKTLLADIERSLRLALVQGAQGFNAAQTADSQIGIKTTIGLVISEVLRQDKELNTAVRNQLDQQRYA